MIPSRKEKSLTAKFWSSVSFNNNKARNAVAPIVLRLIFKTEGMVTLQLIQVIKFINFF
jgi:hypothetical protein